MFGAASLHLLLLRVLTMTRLLAELALASIICLVWLPAGEAFLVPSAAQLPLGKVSIPPLTCGAAKARASPGEGEGNKKAMRLGLPFQLAACLFGNAGVALPQSLISAPFPCAVI